MDKATPIKQRAQALINRGALAEAMAEYVKLLSLEPVNPYAYILIGDLASRMGNRVEAVKRYGEAAEAYESQGLYRNAIAVLKKALRLDGNAVDSLRRLADLYAREGLTTESITHYLDYGSRCVEAGRDDDAREVLELVTKLGSPNARLATRVADLCVAIGEAERAAMELLRSAKDLDKRGMTERAGELRQRAKEIDPTANVADTDLSLGGYEATLDPGALEALDMAMPSSPEAAGTAAGEGASEENPETPADFERTSLGASRASASTDGDTEILSMKDIPRESSADARRGASVLGGLQRTGSLFAPPEGENAANAEDAAEQPAMDAVAEPVEAPVAEDAEKEGPAKAVEEVRKKPVADAKTEPVEEPAQPAVEEPAQPVVEEPAQPVVEEPAQPAVEELAQPAVEEPAPAQPVPDREQATVPEVEPVASEETAATETETRKKQWATQFELSVLEGDRTRAEAIIREVAARAEAEGDPSEARRAYTRLWEMGQREEAVAEKLRRLAVAADDKKAEARWTAELGELRLVAGEWEAAHARFQWALAIDPDEPLARRRSDQFRDLTEDREEAQAPEETPAGGARLDGVSALSELSKELEEPSREHHAPAHAGEPSQRRRPPHDHALAEPGDLASEARPGEPMPARGEAPPREEAPVSDRVPAGGMLTPDAPAQIQKMPARRIERPEMSRIVDLFRDQVGSQIDEQDHAAHYDLGMTYMEMDLLSEAIAEFQQALAGPEYRQRCLELLATCYSRTGEPEQAAIHWRAAIDESGDAVEKTALRYELACALTEAGRAEEAQQELREVLNHDPGFLDAQERLAELGG